MVDFGGGAASYGLGGALPSGLASGSFGKGFVATPEMLAKAKAANGVAPAAPPTSGPGTPDLPVAGSPPAALTTLDPASEQRFQQWVARTGAPHIESPQSPYDMRGYWHALSSGDPAAAPWQDHNGVTEQFPPRWNTPYHPLHPLFQNWMPTTGTAAPGGGGAPPPQQYQQ